MDKKIFQRSIAFFRIALDSDRKKQIIDVITIILTYFGMIFFKDMHFVDFIRMSDLNKWPCCSFEFIDVSKLPWIPAEIKEWDVHILSISTYSEITGQICL